MTERFSAAFVCQLCDDLRQFVGAQDASIHKGLEGGDDESGIIAFVELFDKGSTFFGLAFVAFAGAVQFVLISF